MELLSTTYTYIYVYNIYYIYISAVPRLLYSTSNVPTFHKTPCTSIGYVWCSESLCAICLF